MVQANRQDEYGFFEGASIFAASLKKRGLNVLWRPHDGVHCVINAPEAVDFLMALGIVKQ